MEEWSTKVLELYSSASNCGNTNGQCYDQFLAQKDAGLSIDVQKIVGSYLDGNSAVKDLQKGFGEFFGYDDPSAVMNAFVGGGLTTTLNTEIDAYYVRAQKAEVLRAQASQQIAKAEAEVNKQISQIKIGAAFVGAGVCAVGTAGLLLGVCGGLAMAVVANESVNFSDASYTAQTGIARDTKADLLSNVVSRDTAESWSRNINFGSDLALAGTLAIATGGVASTFMAGAPLSLSVAGAFASSGATMMVVEGIGVSTIGAYGNISCVNRMATSDHCGAGDYALNTLTMVVGGMSSGIGNMALTQTTVGSGVASANNIKSTAVKEAAPTVKSAGVVSNTTKLGETTRVGQWMSPAEYEQFAKTGQVPRSNVLTNGKEGYIKQANPGDYYVEFDINPAALSVKNTELGWSQINSMNKIRQKLALQRGETLPPPTGTNIVPVDKK